MNISNVTEGPASVEDCRHAFDALPFLGSLADDDVRALAPLARIRSFEEKATLFEAGEATDALYLITDGEVEVFSSTFHLGKLPLVTLKGGGLLGEMGLLTNMPRAATAFALTPVRALCFRAVDLN